MIALLLDILPFIMFVLLEKRKGLKVALQASLGLALVNVVHSLVAFQQVEPFFVISFILLMVCAGLSYFKQNDIFFKLQPSIFGFAMGSALLIAFYGFDYAIMSDMFERMQATMENPPPMTIPAEVFYWFSRNFGWGLITLAGVLAVAAMKLPTWVWLTLRIIGLPIVSVIALMQAMNP